MSEEPAAGSVAPNLAALTEAQKKYLLDLARKSILQAVAPGRENDREMPRLSEELKILAEIYAGVFVSLHIREALRGCIGYIEGLRSLVEVVPHTASGAALRDPRFEALREDELQDLEVEISVLTPLENISGPSDIVIGEHGLLVRRGKSQGLLLPQVAVRAGFDALAFLEHTCIKAGLPADAWKLPEAEIYRFGADIFADKFIRS